MMKKSRVKVKVNLKSQKITSPLSQKDPSLYKRDLLIDIVGPMIWARSKQVSGALNNLIVDCLIKAQKKWTVKKKRRPKRSSNGLPD